MEQDTTRLTNTNVDELADALEEIAKSSSKITFNNYQCEHDPARKVGVMRAHDYPKEGLTTAVSFGLSHDSWASANFPDRIELVLTWDSSSLENERLLVIIAECIMKRKRLPKPGVIYLGAVRDANLSELARAMPHAMIVFPYLWSEGFTRVDLDGVRVHFLQVVPVYEEEMQFVAEKGFKNFEEILRYDGAYFEQLQRPSHIMKPL